MADWNGGDFNESRALAFAVLLPNSSRLFTDVPVFVDDDKHTFDLPHEFRCSRIMYYPVIGWDFLLGDNWDVNGPGNSYLIPPPSTDVSTLSHTDTVTSLPVDVWTTSPQKFRICSGCYDKAIRLGLILGQLEITHNFPAQGLGRRWYAWYNVYAFTHCHNILTQVVASVTRFRNKTQIPL